MKTKKHFLMIFGIFLVLSLVLLSCRTSEKAALSCPEFSINKNYKVADNHKKIKSNTFNAHHSVTSRKQPVRLVTKNPRMDIIVIKNSPVKDDITIPSIESISALNKFEYSKMLTASIDNTIIPLGRINTFSPSLKRVNMTKQPNDLIILQPSICDTIVLKSGASLIGKVEEIGQSEIKYRKCNNLTGPLISIAKSDVSSILYSNGTRDLFGPTETYIPNQTSSIYNNNSVLKTEGLGLAGFLSGLVGLFIASIPLGVIAVIFGSISLSKIKKQSQRYKGKGFAIASIILGLIDVVVMIILLAAI